MGNTVGSRETLRFIEHDLLIGSLLGDGCLERNGRYVRLRIAHGLKQKTYLDWKYRALRRIACAPRFVEGAMHKKAQRRYPRWEFSTRSIPMLEHYWQCFYARDGKRSLPTHLDRMGITPRALAVWFMDDGYKRNDCNALRINTDSFSLKDQYGLQKLLRKQFSIETKVHKKGEYWNIYIPVKEAKKFCELIRPFVIPSMRYKVSLTP